MALALAWSAVLAVVAVLAVTGAVVGITVAVRRSLVALAVRLLRGLTDLGMATAVLVAGVLCQGRPLAAVLLWAALAAAVAGLALNVPGRSLAGRAALLADQLAPTDAGTSRRHDATDNH